MSMSLDTNDFDRKFKQIVDMAVPSLVDKGMGIAGLQLMNDAITEVPKAPIDEGTLRGSGSVFVNGRFNAASSYGKPSSKTKRTPIGGGIPRRYMSVATVGFNVPYAAKLHESPHFKFKQSGTGAKYLESKLSRNRKRYMKIVANTIKRGAL